MRNRRIQPSPTLEPSSGRWLRRRCSPRSPSGAPTPSATPTARPDDTYATVVKQRTPASELLERVVGARRGDPAARPRARLHEGASRRSRQQPPGPPRAGRRDPQRDHPNDDELLAPHSCARAEPRMTVDSEAIFAIAAHSRNDARALEQLRGAMATALARRARAGRRLPRARQRPPAVARRGPRQRLLRLDQGRARGRRALLRPEAAQARGPRGHAARARRTARSSAASASGPDLDYVEDDPLPRCAPRRSASSA